MKTLEQLRRIGSGETGELESFISMIRRNENLIINNTGFAMVIIGLLLTIVGNHYWNWATTTAFILLFIGAGALYINSSQKEK